MPLKDKNVVIYGVRGQVGSVLARAFAREGRGCSWRANLIKDGGFGWGDLRCGMSCGGAGGCAWYGGGG